MLNRKSTAGKAAHALHHINLRLERWHRRCIYASAALVVASGSAWLVARYFLRRAGEFGEAIHPVEPWAMKLHGGAGMIMLFFLGSLMNSHIRRAIRAKRNRLSGWSMVGSMALLTTTGFGLYYLADERTRPLWSLFHWGVGLGLPLLMIVHVLAGRASRYGRGPDATS
jgi:hypothetical protein